MKPPHQPPEETNGNEILAELTGWLRNQIAATGRERVILGLSGGLDSAVTAAVCAHVLGPAPVLAAILPANSAPADATDAEHVAATLGITTTRIDLAPVLASLLQALPDHYQPANHAEPTTALGNLKPRLRMIVLYYLANTTNALVIGTSNKTELATGYFTKHGDGAADLLPLGGLYKNQVRQLARQLDVPKHIIDKPPTAGLRPNQTDETDLGLTYQQLDHTLTSLETDHAHHRDPIQQQVLDLIVTGEHKTSTPPTFHPGTRPSSTD